jgi:hypothetical protein
MYGNPLMLRLRNAVATPLAEVGYTTASIPLISNAWIGFGHPYFDSHGSKFKY